MIFRARHQEAFRRVPIYRLSIPLMPSENRFLNAPCKIEYLQRSVVTSSHELAVVRRESEITDWIMMCLYRFNIVEVGLPVFYNSVLISRDEPVFGV